LIFWVGFNSTRWFCTVSWWSRWLITFISSISWADIELTRYELMEVFQLPWFVFVDRIWAHRKCSPVFSKQVLLALYDEAEGRSEVEPG
jgi:hypothetical protein